MSTLIGSIVEVRVSSNNEFQILTNNYNNNSAIFNVIQNDLGNSNNIPFNFNDMIQQTQQETQQGGSGGSETQQGGSGGGETQQGGSGGGEQPETPKNEGVCAVNGGINSIDLLYYIQQIIKKSDNIQKVLLIINNNPFLKSIRKDGRNSSFVKELLISNPAIGPLIDNLQQDINDLLSYKETFAKKDSPEELKEFILLKASNIIGAIGELDSLYKLDTGDFKGGVPNGISVALSAFDVWIKSSLLNLAENEFENKYPNAYDEAWANTTPISGFVGYNELGVYVPASAHQYQVKQREYGVKRAVRSNDPELYDKIHFRKIELETAKWGLGLTISSVLMNQVGSLTVKIGKTALKAGIVLGVTPLAGVGAGVGKDSVALGKLLEGAGTGLGVAIPWLIKGQTAFKKTNYLYSVGDEEQPYHLILMEQINEEYTSLFKIITPTSKNIIEPINFVQDNFSEDVNALTMDLPYTPSIYGNLIFSGSKNNDTLFNIEDQYLVEADEGDDEISNVGEDVAINAGLGNDCVANLGNRVNINGNAGNNNIDNAGTLVTINVADGDNYVGNNGSAVTISAGNGNNYFDNVGNFVKIQAGNGENDVENFGSYVTINTGNNADFIVNYGARTNIDAGSGNDTITDSGDDVTINAGAGNNFILNESGRGLINSDEDDDTIINYGQSVSVFAGAGNDSINNTKYISWNEDTNKWTSGSISPDDVIISAGLGADLIYNYGAERVSINGGDDDDKIYNVTKPCDLPKSATSIEEETPSLFVAEPIQGKTLDVVNDNNSYTENPANVRSIDDAANNSTYTSPDSATLLGGKGNDFIGNEGINAFVSGGEGFDTLYNVGENATLIGGNCNDYIYNNEEYLGLGGKNTSISAGEGDDTITNYADNVTINGDTGNDCIENFVIYGWGSKIGEYTISPDNVKINAGDGDDTITNEGNYVSISGGAGNDVILNVTRREYDTNEIITSPDCATIDTGEGNDTIINEGNNVKFIYSGGQDIIQGFKNNSTLKIAYGNGKYSKSIENDDIILTVGNGKVTLEKSASLKSFHIEGEEISEKPEWSISNDIASYGNNNEILFKLSGINPSAKLSDIAYSESTHKITLYNGALDKKNSVKLLVSPESLSYKLALADNVAIPITTEAHWLINNTNAIYKSKSISSGYSVSRDGKTVSYNNSNGGNTLVTVSGLKTNASVSGISLNGSVVTLSNSVLNQGKVTVSNGYTLKLANDVPKSSITSANWSVSGTTATYKAGATSAGYSLSSDGKTINYVNASVGNELVTVSGLKNNAHVSGISLNGSVVTLSNSVLNQSKVTVSNGYTLKLANDVPKTSTTSAAWSVSGTTATYKASATSAGYALSSDGKTINYNNAGGGNILITISSLKNGVSAKNGIIDGINIKDNVVSVSANLIDPNKVKITGTGYKLEILSIESIPDGISIKNNVLTASNKFTGNTINLNNELLNSVTKVNASSISNNLSIVGNTTHNSIKGGKSEDTINGGDGKDTLFGGNGNDKLYGDADNDVLKGEAGNDSLYGGNGNDTLTGGAGNDIFVYESGNDVIKDYKTNEDKINLNLSAITSSSVKGSDVILTTSNGTLTVKGTKDKVITFVDNNGKTSERIFFANTSYAPLETGLAYDAKRVVLTASNKFTGNKIDLGEYLGTVTKVNSSATSQNINIIGNSADNSIKAGKGADTINGGNGKDTIFGGADNDSLYGGNDNDKLLGDAGNDTLNGGRGNDTLTGGAGNDVFIYEGGNDVITDYTAGQDKIRISSGKISKTTYSGKDVIFTIGSGTLTVKNSKGKKISVTDSNNKSQTYSKTLDLIYDNNFVSDEFGIADVVDVNENNYSVGKLEYSSDNNELANNSIVSASYYDEK